MRRNPGTEGTSGSPHRALLLGAVAAALALLAAMLPRSGVGAPERTAAVLWLAAAATAVFAAAELLALRRSGRGPAASWWFPGTAALAWLVVHGGLRGITGASLVPGDDGGSAFGTGILFNPRDNLSYLSWAVQARRGAHLFQNLLTFEDQPSCYFNPFFWLVGWTARATGASHFSVYHALGILGALATIVLTYRLAHAAGLDEAGARWATVLVAFGSGASAAFRTAAMALGWQPGFGADVRYQDAIPSATFFSYPYHSFTLALLAATLLAALRAEQRTARLPARHGALLAFLAALLTATHPYEGVMVVCTYAVTVLWTLLLRRERGRARARVAAVLVLAALPGLAYAAWISARPAWTTFAEASLDLPRSRAFWLLGYGVLLPAALWGCARVLRRPDGRATWPALWVLCLFVLLVGLDVRQTKVCNGGGLPLVLLAGAGIADAAGRLCALGLARRAVLGTALAGAVLLCFSTTAYLLIARYDDQSLDASLADLAGRIEEHGAAPFPVVLCEVEAARALPALAGAKVFAGHWSLTPDYAARLVRLREAGIESSVPTGTASTAEFAALLRDCRPRFLVLHEACPALAWMPAQPAFRSLGSCGPWTLFQEAPAPAEERRP